MSELEKIIENDSELLAGKFWLYSLDFYQFADVKKRLLSHQNNDGLNVNLILFVLWFSQTFEKQLEPQLVQKIVEQSKSHQLAVEEFRSRRKAWQNSATNNTLEPVELENKSELPSFDELKRLWLAQELDLEQKQQQQIILSFCELFEWPAKMPSRPLFTSPFITIINENLSLILQASESKSLTVNFRSLVKLAARYRKTSLQ